MSQQEFYVSGHSIEKGLHDAPKNLNITGHQRRPIRFQVSPTAQRPPRLADNRTINLEVTATALEARKQERYWSPQASYSAVNQTPEGGDIRQVLSVDENSNVQDMPAATPEVSLSSPALQIGWPDFYSSGTFPMYVYLMGFVSILFRLLKCEVRMIKQFQIFRMFYDIYSLLVDQF